MTFQLHKVCVHHAGAAGNALALRELDLDVAQGEQIALIGPSGAGKTSLISILAGLSAASGGRVLVQGHDVVSDFAAANAGKKLVDDFVAAWTKVMNLDRFDVKASSLA